ncbi:sulfate adenylyltransferase [Methylosinus sp. R-45379]|uniref:sulfate adenylyltransferase subunit CysN n=1 Tax=Methylosinus sp. R-45379 TaxID=980563 RepID=UPI0007C97742|nr:sulfate adenylyltransferase subunit CysN [Methylosinus sp. R-45379]OAI23822.1 sulfate adenylyltransferase [Methylosinus sp. R-45379]
MHGGLATPAPLRAPVGPAPADKPLLRFITCGSVDDGKSTLIGRLLYDADLAADDLIAALEQDSKKHGTQGDDLDFALLVDGLAAEREQGITIDVAYRYFATEKRKFIVADTPGHVQYTRNMATGASTAELAVLLVDARKGLLDQTRRHSVIVSMLGVRHVVVAVNKMDLVSYSQEIFADIERDFRAFAEHLRFLTIQVIPLVAKDGDNLVHASKKMDWYSGPPLLAYLESVASDDNARVLPFRFPVQWVNRPSHDFRGFSGFIAGGNVKPGDIVRILPSGRDTTIARIVTYDGDLAHAVAGQSVTLTLTEEIDISRGDMLVSPVSPAKIGDRLSARLLWLVREPLTLDKSYLLKLGARMTPAFVKQVASHIQIETGLAEPLADSSQTLAFNEIGEAELWLDTAIACDLYEDNRETGGFILIDRVTNETVAVGMVKQSAWTERSARNGVEASYASMEGVPSPDQLLHPTPLRSLVKSLSWRVPGSVITFGAAFLFTQDTGISAAITGTEIVSKIVLYYLHERLWTRFAVGLTKGEPPHDDTGL